MKFKLENPPHQSTAIQSVVEVFRGMERNTYDNAHVEDIHSNICSLSVQEIEFIFSHSALGAGWDNPNVFGIANDLFIPTEMASLGILSLGCNKYYRKVLRNTFLRV